VRGVPKKNKFFVTLPITKKEWGALKKILRRGSRGCWRGKRERGKNGFSSVAVNNPGKC